MKNTRQRGNPPGLPRITNIEVAQKNLPLRITLLALAIVIAIAAFGYGISGLLTTKPGWATIEVSPNALSCSDEFTLHYNLGAGDVSATNESKALKAFYGKLVVEAYQLFHNDFASDELHNIRYVNEHLNEEITVEPALYEALSAIVAAGNRSIYLAPAYAVYQPLFVCENELDAVQLDPQRQAESKAYLEQIARFANDPQMINIQILGDQQIKVMVDQAYLDFIQENEIEYVLDFSWMTNAFVADYIADLLMENGYTNGYLASYDGYTRNLYVADQSFGLNIFHRDDQDVVIPATLNYPGGYSVVTLRDFPIDKSDRWHYYAFDDGRIASLILDAADGAERAAVTSMTCYSANATCSEILLNMATLYIADALDKQQVNGLTEKGIYTVYPDGKTVYTNDAEHTHVYEAYGYSAKPIE